MSIPEDFTGPGYFAGESPKGLTTVAGVPVPAQVQVLWRDPTDPTGTETLVAQTASDAGGTWRITNLNPELEYVVRGRKAGFDDVTIVGAIPTRTDVITTSGGFTADPDTETMTGEVIVEGGLPPYAFTRLDDEPASITVDFDGHSITLAGFAYLEGGTGGISVKAEASNGVEKIFTLPMQALLGTPREFALSRTELFRPTYLRHELEVLLPITWFALKTQLNEENEVLIKLTWKDVNVMGNGFRVYRDSSPIDPDDLPEPIAVLPAATGLAPQDISFADGDVIEGERYHYAVATYLGAEWKITDSKSILAVPAPSEIGEFFQGGYYVGNIVVGADTYAVMFAPEEADTTKQWKTANNATAGTTSDVDGWSNTLAMVDTEALRLAHPAAVYCRNYDGAGFDDWYMPARNELLLPWTYRAQLAALNMGKNSTYVWSSTQHPSNTNNARNWRFSDGNENNNYKNDTRRVRPCRRLKLGI